MIRVEQRQLWRPDDHPDGGRRGDCLRACVASILELDYEAVPDLGGLNQPLNDWVREAAPGLVAPYQYLGSTWRLNETLESWREWPTSHYLEGYWIATVHSSRIPNFERFGCGCTERVPGGDPECKWCAGKPETRSMGIAWGLHAVVMEGDRLAWDPHPERTGEVGPFRGATTFRLADPAPAFHALGATNA
jgi:hypothetical protein